MTTEMEERIAGERVRVRITIGVHEKIAEVEDSTVKALDRIRLGSVKLTRVAIREGVIAAECKGKAEVDDWLDGIWERGGQAPLSLLAFNALADAYAKATDAVEATEGKSEADQETEATAS